jgi:hypothetical protein
MAKIRRHFPARTSLILCKVSGKYHEINMYTSRSLLLSAALCNFIKGVTAGLYTADFLFLLKCHNQPGYFSLRAKQSRLPCIVQDVPKVHGRLG